MLTDAIVRERYLAVEFLTQFSGHISNVFAGDFLPHKADR